MDALDKENSATRQALVLPEPPSKTATRAEAEVGTQPRGKRPKVEPKEVSVEVAEKVQTEVVKK